ncbi:hypothetical protein [Stenotrophomonas maltophilia]|uniref:hypothetical protein n=1 Tax=Stenotrophomonas maltophilia TaxID=40324 RepID=UPI0013DB4BDA|nr:hypothetical protein [Stenotrophomonas maltophilia]
MRVNSISDSFDHSGLLAAFQKSEKSSSKSFDPSLCLATKAKRRARLERQAMRQAKHDEMQARAESRARKQQDRWGF